MYKTHRDRDRDREISIDVKLHNRDETQEYGIARP